MIGIWSDIADAGLAVRASVAPGSYNFQGFDKNGRYTFRIDADGALKWGTSGLKAQEDTVLARTGPGQLTLSGLWPELVMPTNGAIRSRTTSGVPVTMLQVDSGNNFNIGSSTLGGHMQITPGAGKSVRIYDAYASSYIMFADEATKRVAFGTNNISGGFHTIYDATPTTGDTTLAIRDGAARPARLRLGSNAGTYDVGIARDAAGVLAVTDSSTTLSNYRDIKARNHIVAGGVLQNARYTAATLPVPGGTTAPAGSSAYASDARKAGEGPGAGTGIPVWSDGATWRTYYDNTIVAW
jgi:hypothetical protein